MTRLFSIDTTLISTQITPEKTEYEPVLRVAVILENRAGPISEQMTLTVALPAGDRTLKATQQEALARAALLLSCFGATNHKYSSDQLLQWSELAKSLPGKKEK
jgi:hypothetical protein